MKWPGIVSTGTWTVRGLRGENACSGRTLAIFFVVASPGNPGVEAVVDLASGVRVDFRTLNERVNRVSHALTAIDVRPGDRVGLLAPT